MKKIFIAMMLLMTLGSFIIAEAPEWTSSTPEKDGNYTYYVGFGTSPEEALEDAFVDYITLFKFSATEALFGMNYDNGDRVPRDVLYSEILDNIHAGIPLAVEDYRVILEEYSEMSSILEQEVYYVLAGLPRGEIDGFWDEIEEFIDYAYSDVAQEYEPPEPEAAEEPLNDGTPEWVKVTPAPDGEFFYTVGSAQAPRLNMARTRATAEALNRAALLIDAEVETLVRELVGEDPYSDDIITEIVTTATADVVINGHTTLDMHAAEDGTLYVLLAVPLMHLQKPLDESLELVGEFMK